MVLEYFVVLVICSRFLVNILEVVESVEVVYIVFLRMKFWFFFIWKKVKYKL